MIYSLRIYKNEYQPAQLHFIAGVTTVIEESEKVMTITADEATLNKVMSAMFLNDDQFKTVFPEYITIAERRAIAEKELKALQDTIATTLCRCIRDGATDSELFAKYRTFYLNEIAEL